MLYSFIRHCAIKIAHRSHAVLEIKQKNSVYIYICVCIYIIFLEHIWHSFYFDNSIVEYEDLNHSYSHKGLDDITKLDSLVLNYWSYLENSTVRGTSFNVLCFS